MADDPSSAPSEGKDKSENGANDPVASSNPQSGKEDKKGDVAADEDSSSTNLQLRQRVTLSEEQKGKLDPEVATLWTEQNNYIDDLEGQLASKDSTPSYF